MGGGLDAGTVWSSYAAASKSIDPATQPGAFVGSASIAGEVKSGDEAFVAAMYDQANDLHSFVGIYLDKEVATRAAGTKGLVEPRRVDPFPV